ncbi:hypothetical protein FACS1894186_2490 [Alphaproteobacteria bacterium]|nr:hypothetical protein FACS1894186_2490 [Alphaproteobacteria bacterium]
MKKSKAKDFVLLSASGVGFAAGEVPLDRLAPPASPPPAATEAKPPAAAARGFPANPAAPAPPPAKVEAGTLAELSGALEAFPSPLKTPATRFVFSDGNPASRVMLIGEAPGAEEDRQGLPFVGPAGQLLDKMLLAIGLDRTGCYICNVAPWRPPGNRTPTLEEVAAFRPFVMRHIQLVGPRAVLLLGGTAAKCVLDTESPIGRLRGRWHFPAEAAEVPMLATFHPSYLLRSPQYKKEAWADLQLFQTKLAEAG